MRNKLMLFCLALLLAVLPLTASAQTIDPEQKGSISVSLVSKDDGTSMEGAELSVFYVASVTQTTDGKLTYYYTADFADCDFPLDDPDLVLKLYAYVTEHPVDCRTIVTDTHGNAICEDLPLGLYFVKQTAELDGFAPCTSFLVTVPLETEDGFVYHVDASPKTSVAQLIDITIRKVWNTDEYTPISGYVTVQLLRNNTVVATAILNDANEWQIIYTDMPESDAYSIIELDVPKGFIATYSQSGYLFTVTNTASLPHTGQIVWPIPVFALAGILFLMLGFVLLRKPGNQDA